MVTVPIKFGLSFPIIFHTLSGVRHLFWDITLKGINNKDGQLYSQLLFATSFVGAGVASVM